MNNTQLDTALISLVNTHGYNHVRSTLTRVWADVKKDASKPTPKRTANPTNKPRYKPNAVSIVRKLDISDSNKREIIMILAERFERKKFLPDIGGVRMLMRELGMDIYNMKVRTQRLSKLFQALSTKPIDYLTRVKNSQSLAGIPSDLQTIANAIERAGNREIARQQQESTV